jgi:5-methylcytosine-specific restriction endonuclease McrA
MLGEGRIIILGKYTKKNPKFFENIRINNDNIKERKCRKCGEWKPETLEFFYMRNKKKPKLGFNAECIICSRKRSNKYVQENLEIVLERNENWKEKNRDKNLGYMRNHYQHNKDGRREYVKSWIHNNPDRAKEYNQNRQNKNHNITKLEWQNCKNHFNNECAYCGLPITDHYRNYRGKLQKIDLHKEHVDHEGSSDLSNCVPACQTCNSIKNLKTIDELFESNLIENFTEERYNRIMNWVTGDYKQYIDIQEVS